MQVQGINIQQLQLQMIQQMVKKFSPEAAETLDIGSILNGSQTNNGPSGVDLSQIEQTEIYSLMSSVMDTLMIARMFESMGMNNPFATQDSDYTDSTTTAGNTTNKNGITIPGIEDIIKGSEITVEGQEGKQEVSESNYDNTTGDLIITVGSQSFKRINGIGIDNQNTFGNVFVEVKKESKNIFGNIKIDSYQEQNQNTLYYYYNGKMTKIDNISTINADEANGTRKVALGAVVYTIQKEDNKLNLVDANGNKKEITSMGTDTTSGREVYKVGNATYELESGVLVPRSTQMEVGGTIEIVTPAGLSDSSTTTTNVSGRVTRYIAGKEIQIDNILYTRYEDKEKKYNPTLNIYTATVNGTKQFYILEGTTLTQFHEDDIQYFRSAPGTELKATGEVFVLDETENGNIVLQTGEDEDKYFITEENGERKVQFYDESEKQFIDVTENASFYNTVSFNGQIATVTAQDSSEAALSMAEIGQLSTIILTVAGTQTTLTVTHPPTTNPSTPAEKVAAKLNKVIYATSGTPQEYYTFSAGMFTKVDALTALTTLTIERTNATLTSSVSLNGTTTRLIIQSDKLIIETLKSGKITATETFSKVNITAEAGDAGEVSLKGEYSGKLYSSNRGGYYELNGDTLKPVPFYTLVELGIMKENGTSYATDKNGNKHAFNLDNIITGNLSLGKIETYGCNDEVKIAAINPAYIVVADDTSQPSTLSIINAKDGSFVKSLDVSTNALNALVKGITNDAKAFNAVQTYFNPNIIGLAGSNASKGGLNFDKDFDNWAHSGISDGNATAIENWMGNVKVGSTLFSKSDSQTIGETVEVSKYSVKLSSMPEGAHSFSYAANQLTWYTKYGEEKGIPISQALLSPRPTQTTTIDLSSGVKLLIEVTKSYYS